MARMVDADALAKAIGVYTYMQTEWTPATAWGVPIVDAEPVVRCKDCQKWCICHKSDDFYCADGERREDGKID